MRPMEASNRKCQSALEMKEMWEERPSTHGHTRSGPQVLALLVLLRFILVLSQSEEPATERSCLFHDDCDAEEFCRVSSCMSMEGVQLPCGTCSPCRDCLCHSKASDGKCPTKCAFESAWVTLFQGVFAIVNASRDEAPEDIQLEHCVQLWDIQGRFFSSYYMWIPSESSLDNEGKRNCTERRVEGVFELDILPVRSTLSLTYTTPLGQLCESRVATLSNDCKGGLEVDWLSTDGEPSEGSCADPNFPESTFRLVRTENILEDHHAPWQQDWEGTVLMYSTSCTAALSFTSVLPSRNIFRWFADVYNCSVGPDPAEARPGDSRRFVAGKDDIVNSPSVSPSVLDDGFRRTKTRLEADVSFDIRAERLVSVVPAASETEFSNCDRNASSRGSWVMESCNPQSTCFHFFGGSKWSPSDRSFDAFFTEHCLFNATFAQSALCRAFGHAFVCLCDRGFRGDGWSCAEVNECEDDLDDCDADADCSNTAGSFHCHCNLGFTGDGVHCDEVDECKDGLHDCHRQAACSNTVGSFSCVCTQGFQGDGVSCDPTSSLDVERVYPNGVKLVFVLTWTMTAPPSSSDVIALFKLGVVRRHLLWAYTSAPECEKPQAVCVGAAQCSNLCHQQGSAAVGQSRSLNLEVFSAGTGTYQVVLYSHAATTIVAHAQYTVELAPFTTTPAPGTNPDPDSPPPAPPIPPPPGTALLETVGEDTGFTAHGGLSECDPGGGECVFVYSDSSSVYIPGLTVQTPPVLRCGDGRTSEAAAERCDDGNIVDGDGCNRTCHVEGGYACAEVVIPQIEFDEATGLYHTAGEGGDSRCTRLPHCGDGRRNVAGEECDDGNEEDGDGCSRGCEVEGGWECEVDEETQQEVCAGVVVRQFDKRNCPQCHSAGECVLYAGVERCRCLEGYSSDAEDHPTFPNPMLTGAQMAGQPHVCDDVDECKWGRLAHRHLCDHASLLCVNTPGSFSCGCGAGMEYIPPDLDVKESTAQCIDINECERVDASSRTGLVHDCHADARCANSAGGYKCSCPEFFSGSGFGADGCIDVNECLNLTHKCSAQATCINHRMGFTCQCAEGLAGSGFVCIDAGWYEDNRDLWELMGQDGAPRRQQGELRAGPMTFFLPHLVGTAELTVSGAGGVRFAAMYQQPSQRVPPTLVCGGQACAPMTDTGEGRGRVEVELALHTAQSKCVWTFSKFVGNHVLLTFLAWDLEPAVHHVEVCQHDVQELLINYYRQGSFRCVVYNATRTPPRQLVLTTPSWIELHTKPVSSTAPEVRQWLPADRLSSRRGYFVFDHESFVERHSIPDSAANADPLRVRYAPGIWPPVRGEEEGLLLGISNKAGDEASAPCSFEEGYRQPHSVFNLRPRKALPVLDGLWHGECLTVGTASRDAEQCAVDVTVKHGVLMLWLSGCRGAIGAGLTTGKLVARGKTEKMWLSVETEVVWIQRYDIFFTSGDERRTRFGSKTVGKVSVTWNDAGQEDPTYRGSKVSLAILRPGETNAAGTEYPGDSPDTMEFGTYDCGVMSLSPLQQTEEFSLALPSESRATPFLQAALAVELFRQCNASVSDMQANLSTAGVECSVLASLIDTRRWASLPEVSSWERVCVNECYSSFRAFLDGAVAVCTAAWHKFAESPWVDIQNEAVGIEVDRVKNFFAARVVTVLDLKLRLDLACHENLDNSSCLRTAALTPALFDTCSTYQHAGAAWRTVLDFVSPAFLVPSTAETEIPCPPDCFNAILEGTVGAHCCYAFVHNAKAQWLEAFIPSLKFPNPFPIDLAPYTCGYDEQCLAKPSPYRLHRSTEPDSCSSEFSGLAAEPCAHDACGVQLWHAACCPRLSCGNGGRVPYQGACWCECPIPHVGVECTGRAMHVTVAMTINDLTIQRFDEAAFLRALATTATVEEHMVEMGRLTQVAGASRREGGASKAVQSERSRGSAWRRGALGRRAGGALEAGARVLAATAEDAARVAKWLNGEGGVVWRERVAAAVLGASRSVRQVDSWISEEAVPRAADGSVICLGCESRPQLVEGGERDGGGGMSAGAAVGLSVGLAALLCLLCCYVRCTERALGGVPRKMGEAVREAGAAAIRMVRSPSGGKKKARSREERWIADKRGVFDMKPREDEEDEDAGPRGRQQPKPYFAGPQSNQQVHFRRDATPRVRSHAPEQQQAVFHKRGAFGKYALAAPVEHEDSAEANRTPTLEFSSAPAPASMVGAFEWAAAPRKPRKKEAARRFVDVEKAAAGEEAVPGQMDWVRRVLEGQERIVRQQRTLLHSISLLQAQSAQASLAAPPSVSSHESPPSARFASLSPPSSLHTAGLHSWDLGAGHPRPSSQSGSARLLYPGRGAGGSSGAGLSSLLPIGETSTQHPELPPPWEGSSQLEDRDVEGSVASSSLPGPSLPPAHHDVEGGDVEGSVASLLGPLCVPAAGKGPVQWGAWRAGASGGGGLGWEGSSTRSGAASARSVGGGSTRSVGAASMLSGESSRVREGWMGADGWRAGMGALEDGVSLPAHVTRHVLRNEDVGSMACSPRSMEVGGIAGLQM